MEELMNAIADANNVKSVKFSKKKGEWLIKYKNGLPGTYCHTNELIDFIQNA